MKTIVGSLLFCFGIICNCYSAEKPRMVFLDSPHDLFQYAPALQKVEYRSRLWEKTLVIPYLGEKKVILNFFEFNITPRELTGEDGAIGLTMVKAVAPRDLQIVVGTQLNPDDATVANEAVNALLPEWLIDEGIDMFKVYSLPMGQYLFEWEGRHWSFDQLTELLSWIVPGQTIPGGYMSKDASRICTGIQSIAIEDHYVYGLIMFMLEQHGCNLTELHRKSAEVMQSFMATAPRF